MELTFGFGKQTRKNLEKKRGRAGLC